jgi:hypothetical protein
MHGSEGGGPGNRFSLPLWGLDARSALGCVLRRPLTRPLAASGVWTFGVSTPGRASTRYQGSAAACFFRLGAGHMKLTVLRSVA